MAHWSRIHLSKLANRCKMSQVRKKKKAQKSVSQSVCMERRYLVLSKTSIRHLVLPEDPCCLVLFGTVQNAHEWIWSMPDGFGEDQTSRIFWCGSNVLSDKAMAPLSSTLAWRIPGTGQPGGLPAMGSHRVRRD